jgi:hypothetical protein
MCYKKIIESGIRISREMMTFQNLTFVTNTSRVTYKITEKPTSRKRELSRSFIREESSTIYGFLEDFPNEDFEWKVPVDANPQHFEKLFDLIQNPIDVDNITGFYSKYFTDCPSFWLEAFSRKSTTLYRGYNPCSEIFI